MIKEDQVPLNEFFSAVERRLDKKFPGKWPSFQIEVCGHVIEMRFSTKIQAEKVSMEFQHIILSNFKTPSAVFKFWIDDCTQYLPSEHINARWKIEESNKCLWCSANLGFIGADLDRYTFYSCHHSERKANQVIAAHSDSTLYFQWGKSEDLLMLHGAVVGAEGKGILIVGRSGAGKSTLSVSCLLAGMDFVGDDYVFLSAVGEIKAFPLYSMVCLNQDMIDALRPDMPLLWQYRKNKWAMSAAKYEFASELPIRAIVVPAIAQADKPEILPFSSERAITRIAYSSVSQMLGIHDTELMRAIIDRLTGLPAYEFRQCRDFQKNAEFLCKFIIKEL